MTSSDERYGAHSHRIFGLVGSLRCPQDGRSYRRNAVEGEVDIGCVKLRGVVAKPLCN